MKYKIFKIVILFFVLTTKSFALVSVDITRGNLDPLPIAISDFYLDSKLADNIKKLQLESKIPELIQNNLSRSGLFFALEKKSFIQRPEPAHNKPRFEDWAFIKTQVLITGKISLEKEGRLRVEFKLWDVVSATELSALAFYTTPDNWRRVSHMISDKIYERLTGEKGYFDSRIIYVSETGPKVDRKKRLAVMDQDGYGVKYLTLGNELVLTPRFSPT
ncbi:MAG: Tol-Pal system protein TolB, partial [Proteobacteria bacterium]|nr:Tol-Pal system protein TolB [Candidatus Fonsibacter sp. PEL4]